MRYDDRFNIGSTAAHAPLNPIEFLRATTHSSGER